MTYLLLFELCDGVLVSLGEGGQNIIYGSNLQPPSLTYSAIVSAVLRDAQKRKVPNLGPRRVEKMIMDAKAISDGHSAMVDMNAQKAEYEFLGVGFWS